MMSHRRYPAYSLLEVGIVLLILGLLLGGILKGTDILDSAKVTSLAQQYQDFRLATYTFLDRYGALPGDFNNASTTLDPSLSNGDGDGRLEGQGLANGSQAHLFWQHLKGAKLLEGVPFDATYTVPSSKIGAVWTVEQDPFPGYEGVWMLLGTPSGGRAIGGGLTPSQAQILLRQIDDGAAGTGRVRAMNGATSGSGSCLKPDGLLNTAVDNPTCVIAFKLI